MNVTKSRLERTTSYRGLSAMVSAEQKEYAEVFDYSKITEKMVSPQTIGRTIS